MSQDWLVAPLVVCWDSPQSPAGVTHSGVRIGDRAGTAWHRLRKPAAPHQGRTLSARAGVRRCVRARVCVCVCVCVIAMVRTRFSRRLSFMSSPSSACDLWGWGRSVKAVRARCCTRRPWGTHVQSTLAAATHAASQPETGRPPASRSTHFYHRSPTPTSNVREWHYIAG